MHHQNNYPDMQSVQAIKVGFCGARIGMTVVQRSVLSDLLAELNVSEAHHSDTLGSDVQFHKLIRTHTSALINVHPSVSSVSRAFCDTDLLWPASSYDTRYRQIIKACDLIIACPAEFEEQPRYGVWPTIKDAHNRKKQLKIILPDGKIVNDYLFFRQQK